MSRSNRKTQTKRQRTKSKGESCRDAKTGEKVKRRDLNAKTPKEKT
jgi:hypothetical protein